MDNGTLEELIGGGKLLGDFESVRHKCRYQASPTVVPGQPIEFILPKYDDRHLDLRNIFLCMYLQGSSVDPNARFDGSTVQCVIDRIVVQSGSVTLCDIAECGLLFQSLYDLNTEVNESTAQKYCAGDMSDADKIAAFALAAPGREYIVHLAPRGSLLNSKCLLPIGRTTDLRITITFASAAKSIYSPLGSVGSTWIGTAMELHLDYIKSQKISTLLTNSPFNVT
jgi:hypothetical protein